MQTDIYNGDGVEGAGGSGILHLKGNREEREGPGCPEESGLHPAVIMAVNERCAQRPPPLQDLNRAVTPTGASLLHYRIAVYQRDQL